MSTEEQKNTGESSEILHWLEGISCPECFGVNAPEHSLFVGYFENGASRCNRCEKTFDLWTRTIDQLKSWPTSWVAFHLLGAIVTRFTFTLEPDRNVEVNLTTIPENAEILKVSVMPMPMKELSAGVPLMPALSLQNEMRLDPFPRRFYLYGKSHGRADLTPSQVWLAVTWIDPDDQELSVHHLADAARQFAAGRYKGMIIPANVAVEAALTPAVNKWIRGHCSREETDDFLGPRGATCAHQLKVLTKIAARELAIKPMPESVRTLLNELRQYRNDLSHRGVLDNPKRPSPDQGKAGDFLAAAIFGYHYARYLSDGVQER